MLLLRWSFFSSDPPVSTINDWWIEEDLDEDQEDFLVDLILDTAIIPPTTDIFDFFEDLAEPDEDYLDFPEAYPEPDDFLADAPFEDLAEEDLDDPEIFSFDFGSPAVAPDIDWSPAFDDYDFVEDPIEDIDQWHSFDFGNPPPTPDIDWSPILDDYDFVEDFIEDTDQWYSFEFGNPPITVQHFEWLIRARRRGRR